MFEEFYISLHHKFLKMKTIQRKRDLEKLLVLKDKNLIGKGTKNT